MQPSESNIVAERVWGRKKESLRLMEGATTHKCKIENLCSRTLFNTGFKNHNSIRSANAEKIVKVQSDLQPFIKVLYAPEHTVAHKFEEY